MVGWYDGDDGDGDDYPLKPDEVGMEVGGDGFILRKFSSLAALEAVKMTIPNPSAASYENLVKMTTFSCQWLIKLKICWLTGNTTNIVTIYIPNETKNIDFKFWY